MAALHRELRDGSYRHGPYHYFQIHDPKTRTVAAADFRDRVVHHAIVRVLEPLFEPRFIEDSYACRKGRGTHAAMRRAAGFARRFPFALKCDVSRYFPSIDHDVLFEQVERVVGDARLLALLGQIVASHADGERTEWLGEGLFDLRVRRASVRRFERRYRRRRFEVERFGADAEALSQSVRSWVAHARHAKSRELRRAVLAGR